MNWQRVRFDEVAPTPWKNGGGWTRELLAWPDRVEWRLRMSVADIVRDGPFSAFPGVDRLFAVLDGAGVWLDDVRVEAGARAHAFPGEQAPVARLVDGPTRDLNLMLRRDWARGRLERCLAGTCFAPGDAATARPGDVILIGAWATAPTLLSAGGEALSLAAGELAWCARPVPGAGAAIPSLTVQQGGVWAFEAVCVPAVAAPGLPRVTA